MKNWIKILFPIVGFAYCVAFLEINLPGGVHQTWNDEYDAYVVTQNNNDVPSANQSVDLTFPNSVLFWDICVVALVFRVFFFLLIPFFILIDNSSGLYLKNCTFLI